MDNTFNAGQTPIRYGLIGYPLGHSFSKKYFTEKFEKEHIANTAYDLFPIEEIEHLPDLIDATPGLEGLNVTIPYKQAVIEYLNDIDASALAIGAVNCVHFSNGRLKGYNTDAVAFEQSLKGIQNGRWADKTGFAVVLGDGGAARAVHYVLRKLELDCVVVSRKKGITVFGTDTPVILWEKVPAHLSALKLKHPGAPVLIVNTTPIGMAPDINECPDLPFDLLGAEHLVFDLIYNPEETVLLSRANDRGCTTKNGLEMLYLQADAAWKIWNSGS